MIKFLLRLKESFVKLSWIKSLITAWVITSSAGRALEDAIFTVYAWIISYLWKWLDSWVRTDPRITIYILLAWFAKAIISAILKSMRDNISLTNVNNE